MIYCDPREDSKIVSYLKTVMGKTAISTSDELMDSGDFAFEGKGPDGPCVIGVERKKLDDLMSSIRSGRLAEQFAKMSVMYEYVYLLVEGAYRSSDNGTLEVFRGKVGADGIYGKFLPMRHGNSYYTYSEIHRALLTFQLRANTMVEHSLGQFDSALVLRDLYNYWQKNWDEHHAHEAIKSQGGVTLEKASLVRRVAAELPGVGWKRSKDVEITFPSIKDMVQAGEMSWQHVLGEKTGSKVYSALRREMGRGK